MGFENQFIVKQLSNNDLVTRFGKLVQTERKITHLILECIAEIDSRRIYLEKAYPSLFEFLVKEFGYSPSAANRRIESARLLREIPEVASKIESGALNLSQLSQLQQATRQAQKIDNRRVAPSEKRELLFKIENATQAKTELILAQELSLPVVPQNKETTHRDESVTLTITFTKAQITLLEQARDLVAHAVPEQKWAEVIAYLANKEIKRRTGVKKRSVAASATEVEAELQNGINVAREDGESVPKDSQDEHNMTCQERRSQPVLREAPFAQNDLRRRLRKPIPARVRKSVFEQQPSCQYKDPTSGRICTSTRFLQIDHVQSVSAGGGNKRENLQTFCAQHNRFKFQTEKSMS